MKKRISALVLSLVMVLGLLAPAALAAGELPYKDVPADAWYVEAVRYAHETGMMNGTAEGQFSPDATTTRATVVTLLHRAEKTPEAAGEAFTDVPAGAWYAKAVAWASANQIVNGMGDKTFAPDAVITREQFATILYRYAKFKGVDVSKVADLSKFPDASSVSEFAKTAMAWAVQVGLISGTDLGTLEPLGSATRAQAATILMRYQKTVAPAAPTPSATPAPTPSPSRKPNKHTAINDGGYSAPSKSPIASVAITRGGSAVTGNVSIGDELAYAVTPAAATYNAEWRVTTYTYKVNKDTTIILPADTYDKYEADGDQRIYSVTPDVRVFTGETFTVTPADANAKITVKVTGKDSYSGEKTASVNVEASKALVPEGETAPRVSVSKGAAYRDASGNTIQVAEDSALTLTIKKTADPLKAEDMGIGANAAEKASNLVATIAKAAGAKADDLKNALDKAAAEGTTLDDLATFSKVAVDLKLDDQEIHPVGETSVLLSAAELGVTDAKADLNDYVVFAQHENIDGTKEMLNGKVVTVDDKQYVQLTLNGLSRIWIGNVPPRTVTFDAAGGAPTPEAQKVKFGGYAKYVEPPKRDGYVFSSWDHDLNSENIIDNITVKALWVKGETAKDDQLTTAWAPAAPAADSFTEAKANGTVKLTLTNAEGYTANLGYILTLTPPAGAERFALGKTAEDAMAATEYLPISGNEDKLTLTATVTDGSGKPLNSSANLYVKFILADGNGVLQSMTLAVGNAENYDTKTRTETFDIDRGLGVISAYLTGGKAEGVATSAGAAAPTVELPDYEANLNAYLNTRTVKGEPQRYLRVNANAYNRFSDIEGVASGTQVGNRNYSGIKLVLAPFQGESFSTLPTVKATYRDDKGTDDVELATDVKLEEGKVVITAVKPPVHRYTTEVNFTLALGGKTQNVDFYWHDDYDMVSKSATTWDEVVKLLAEDENVFVHYIGTEDVILTEPLTLKPNQDLYLGTNDKSMTLTIGKGGVLTLEGNDLGGAYLLLQNSSLVVADGGVLTTNAQNEDQSRYCYTVVRTNGSSSAETVGSITAEKGGKISVPDRGYLMLDHDGGVKLQEGSEVITSFVSGGRLEFRGGTELAGSITTAPNDNRWGYVDFEEGLTVTKTGKLTIGSGKVALQVYGGLTNDGEITVSSSNNNSLLSGASVNNGTITVSSGALLKLANTGHGVVNKGTIQVDGNLGVDGSILVNTGSITGSGALTVLEGNNVEARYDEVNGLEYVDDDVVYKDRTPAKYPRYKFIGEPPAQVEATVFIGELSNQDAGTCTVTVTEKK